MNKIRSILLVDDDEATNFINELLIDDLQITDELLVAQNGKEAIELIMQRLLNSPDEEKKQHPQLILLDINMPVMDGFDFLEAYKAITFPGKEAAVIAVLTTSLNPRDLERVKKAGVSNFLSKPLTEQALNNLAEKCFS